MLYTSCTSPLYPHRPRLLPACSPHVTALYAGAAPGGEDDAAPPYVLMEAPPLAVFVNGVLAALNELRHCAPLALRDLFAARLQVGCGTGMTVLSTWRGRGRVTHSIAALNDPPC